ncbi:MAG: hypothetical protein IJ524_04540 [Bacteroidales bacterium]|nr:hypothetical protein [Bacteroidales bacterium]
MKHIVTLSLAVLLLTACRPTVPALSPDESCADALMAYAADYPAAEPQDLYKLVFQDLYGPGHLLTDSAACAYYINDELASMADSNGLPDYSYTLCDNRFVRVNLLLVQKGVLSVEQLTSAVMRSAQGLPQPDHRFVMSHSAAFKAAYDPHYRIVRSDIFEQELLPLIQSAQ